MEKEKIKVWLAFNVEVLEQIFPEYSFDKLVIIADKLVKGIDVMDPDEKVIFEKHGLHDTNY